MKQHILPAVRLTLVCMVFFMGMYTFIIWVAAQAAPNRGQGETVSINGEVRGWRLVGQKFTGDKFFWGRPSAVDYNAAASGGSNKGPTNPEYLRQVQDRIDTFRIHNPGISASDIPSDLVTASGSGLDPDISVMGAYVQVKRIARVRGLTEQAVKSIVDREVRRPFFGLFGTESVNVLQLNMELEKIK